MHLKYILLILSSLNIMYIRSDDNSEEAGVVAGVVTQLTMEQHMDHLDQSMADLKMFLNSTFGSQLSRIEALVTSLERRELLAKMCHEDFCGAFGKCNITEDMQNAVCECELGHRGEHCEFEAPCDVEYNKYLEMLPLPGLSEPNCDTDGSFAGMQYMGSMAYCVTRNGIDIGYSVPRWETGAVMNCQCARDEYAYMHTDYIEHKIFDCAQNGNY